MPQNNDKVLNGLRWATLLLALFISCTYAAWIALAKISFFYPVGYEILDIDRTIEKFAPVNHYKDSFQLTNKIEHYRLFTEIVAAVTHQGNGLADIHYHTPDGTVLGSLLTPAEIAHLQDVANLISLVNAIGIGALLVFALLFVFLKSGMRTTPSLTRIHIFGALLAAAIVLTVVGVGAENVFYAAHRWVFPDDHQWFFYYEESLMTTLMKAPDLFGFIAVELLMLTLIFYSASLVSLKRLFKHD